MGTCEQQSAAWIKVQLYFHIKQNWYANRGLWCLKFTVQGADLTRRKGCRRLMYDDGDDFDDDDV